MAEKVIRNKINVEEIKKVNSLTPRVQRLRQAYMDSSVMVAGDRARWYLEAFKQTEGEDRCKREAKAFALTLERMPIVIRDDELIVGMPSPYIRGAHPLIESAPANLEYLLKQDSITASTAAVKANVTDEDRQSLIEACEYFKEHLPNQRALDVINEYGGGKLWKKGQTRITMTGSPFPQVLAPGADYERAINKGFNDFIKQAEDHIESIRSKPREEVTGEDREKIEFLESVIITLKGVIRFAHRHADLAREMAAKQKDPVRKKELEEIAEVCDWVPANPARNFREAIQTYWFIVVAHDVEKAAPNNFAGRWDQYMYPLYEKDINEGRLTRQEAGELVGVLVCRMAAMTPFLFRGSKLGSRDHQAAAMANYFINVTLGGIDRRGKDACNELTCLFLHVVSKVKTHQPHVSLRFHRAMPPEVIDFAIDCNLEYGGGVPAWFNDRVAIDYLLDRGIGLEDARDWAECGCVNTAYPKSFGFTRPGGAGFVNHAKLLFLALNDGIEETTGELLGARTGDATEFSTFDEVLSAYKKQVEDCYEFRYNYDKIVEPLLYEDTPPRVFISSLLEGCIESGKDTFRGGNRYPQMETGMYVDRGIQDAADSLAAIKKVVFEDKQATMAELLDALKADFVGYNDLRAKLMAAPKYGNDDDYADSIATDIWDYSVAKVMSFRNCKNNRYILLRQGASWSQWAGEKTGALPNGRKAGTPLADASVSAVRGCDVSGPTALLNSVAKLDPAFMEGPLLNVKLAPGVLKTKGAREKFAELIATYFDKGGNHIQFNILDKKTLQDARKNPENYRNLVVRVAGYSAFWVELTPEMQDEIITRTEQEFVS